jgi:arylsulfatase A-like enzyme
MPLMIRAPGIIKPGTINDDIVSNVDFAPTWLDYAGLKIPTYMQGDSFFSSLKGTPNPNPDQVAYHRYWMHADDIHNAYVGTVTQ